MNLILWALRRIMSNAETMERKFAGSSNSSIPAPSNCNHKYKSSNIQILFHLGKIFLIIQIFDHTQANNSLVNTQPTQICILRNHHDYFHKVLLHNIALGAPTSTFWTTTMAYPLHWSLTRNLKAMFQIWNCTSCGNKIL